MKTAGQVLSVLFDRQFMEKAREYSDFFDSWSEITAKNGIAAASAHSRIKDVDRGILLVETDHPGWKQILQTKQSSILDDYRSRFPDLGISGISLILGKTPFNEEPSASEEKQPPASFGDYSEDTPAEESFAENFVSNNETISQSLDAIKDEDLKKTLKNIKENIKAQEKSAGK